LTRYFLYTAAPPGRLAAGGITEGNKLQGTLPPRTERRLPLLCGQYSISNKNIATKKLDKETNMLLAYVFKKKVKIHLPVSVYYSNLTPSHRTRMAKHIRKKPVLKS